MLKAALFKVFELAGNEIDHIPSVMVGALNVDYFNIGIELMNVLLTSCFVSNSTV